MVTRRDIERALDRTNQHAELPEWAPPKPPPHCPECGLIFKQYRPGVTAMLIRNHVKHTHEALWYGSRSEDVSSAC